MFGILSISIDAFSFLIIISFIIKGTSKLPGQNHNTKSLCYSFFKQHRLIIFTVVPGIIFLVMQRLFTNYLTKSGSKNVSIGDDDFNIFTGALTFKKAHYEVTEMNPVVVLVL